LPHQHDAFKENRGATHYGQLIHSNLFRFSSFEFTLPTMHIRDATVADLPAIVAVYNSTVPSRMVTADTTPVSVESRQKWFDEHRPERRPLWVAEEQGEITGWLSYSSFYGRPAYDGTCEISLYISEKYRRRGLGRKFLERAIVHAPAIHVKVLLGFIFGHNEPSLRLFENLGFQHWAHLPRVAVLDGVERDLVILGRRCP
jgi:phosphinothricin acetyltransferase